MICNLARRLPAPRKFKSVLAVSDPRVIILLWICASVASLYLLVATSSPWIPFCGFAVQPLSSGKWSNRSCEPVTFATTPLPITALASVPGAGNTWLRYLLQQATGILTGSVYTDSALYDAGFVGEGITNGSVLAIKTHSSHLQEQRRFHRVILLLRDPYDAILAEFNRQQGGPLEHANQKDFDTYWKTFVPLAAGYWFAFNTEWLKFSGPLKIVHFHSLVSDLDGTLRELLYFLNLAVSEQRLECTLLNSIGKFKRLPARGYTLKKSDAFTDDMVNLIETYKQNFALVWQKRSLTRNLTK